GVPAAPATAAAAAAAIKPNMPGANAPAPASGVGTAKAPAAVTVPAAAAPAVAAPVAVAPAAPVTPAPPPATQLPKIVFSKGSGDGEIALTLNGAVAANLEIKAIESPPPRLLLVIPGIQHLTTAKVMEIRRGNLLRVRLGTHSGPDELHLVVDLKKT